MEMPIGTLMLNIALLLLLALAFSIPGTSADNEFGAPSPKFGKILGTQY
jgi:hypothetical protein